MSKRESITRYVLIINKLRRQPASFSQILDYLNHESELKQYNYNISIRTFKRDIEDIRSNFGIYIEFDFSEKLYKITDDTFNEGTERILEAFETFNALSISERVSKYVHFDKRSAKGTEHLYHILQAIEKRKVICFDYQKYWNKAQTFNRAVEPYALKEFKNRWYLLAKDTKDEQLKTFALERIDSLSMLRAKFSYPKDFEVQEYFQNSFGIIRPTEDKPQKVELSFEPGEADYLKSLPLHHSQQILDDNEEEFVIRLHLNITYDFVKELLAYGERVKVLKPKALAKDIANNAQMLLSYYE